MKQALFLNLFFAAIALAAGSAWGHGPDDHSHGDDVFSAGSGSGPITLSDTAIANLQLQTTRATKKDIGRELVLNARVHALPNKHAKVSAPFDGKVTSIAVAPGASVKKGDVLLSATPLQAASSPVTLEAPISGSLVTPLPEIGAPFTSAETLTEVANLDEVLVIGESFRETDLADLETGKPAYVKLNSEVLTGAIERTAVSTSSNRPAYQVIARFTNPRAHLLPGQVVTLHLVTIERKGVVTVPERAVLGELGNHFVFVRRGNTFERREVRTGFRGSFGVGIRRGVGDGEEVVTQGAYQLQFVTGNAKPRGASQDADHGHDHGHSHGHGDHQH